MAVGSCPECGGRLIRDRGEVVCSSCGLVLSEEIDWGPEWRAFTPEERERRERVGAPINPLIGNALTTEVGWSLGRLRWWHEVVTASSVRLVARGRATVEKVASQLGLPERVKDLAVQYFVRGVRAGVSKGRPARALAAAAVYAACRAHGVPRTLREIARTAGAPRRRAFRCYRLLVEAGVRVPRADPRRYAVSIAARLGLPPRVTRLAVEVLDMAEERRLARGGGPAGLAAGAVYTAALMTGKHRSQEEVARAAEVSVVTVRKWYKLLTEELGLEIPVKARA